MVNIVYLGLVAVQLIHGIHEGLERLKDTVVVGSTVNVRRKEQGWDTCHGVNRVGDFVVVGLQGLGKSGDDNVQLRLELQEGHLIVLGTERG
ncbi:hypothetical protein EDD21DRAFT_393210 [Dissophora ornata]|nr:hypothetical protein EDD21DRAFT_393210 [Dissophora ornata]